MLRPSAYLTFTLEGADIASATASAIKRSYTYLAPTTIVAGRREAAVSEDPLANRMTLEVRLPGTSCWDANDDTWRDVLMPWLTTKLRTLFGTVAECNNESRPSYSGTVHYASIDLRLEPHPVRVELDPASTLRSVEKPLQAMRTYLAREDVDPARITGFAVPSDTTRGNDDWLDVTFEDGTTRRVAV